MESSVPTFAGCRAPSALGAPLDAAGLPLWPPRVRGAGWRVGEGLGTVAASTTLGRTGEGRHELSLVDLDDGGRLLSRVVGVAPGPVAIGLRVRLAWDGELPLFAPAAA